MTGPVGIPISAVVLAAGNSERMGRPKALLPWEGDTFLGLICRRLREAWVSNIVVALGRDEAAVRAGWRRADERIVVNQRPEDGQLSSLKLALRQLEVGPSAEAALVCLVDTPLVKAETYSRLIQEWSQRRGTMVVPRFEGKRGHPLVLDRRFWQETQLAPLDQGLHSVTRKNAAAMLDVDVADRGVVSDIDTPEEYEKALKTWN